MSDDHMVRDFWTGFFWIVVGVIMLPAIYITYHITRFVAWVDSFTAHPIGQPWYRFMNWYWGLVWSAFGGTDLTEALPDSSNTP